MVVKSELDRLVLHYSNVELGETDIIDPVSTEQMDTLKNVFKYAMQELL